MTGPNVLRRRRRATAEDYQNAVSDIIRSIQGNLTDDQLAAVLGVSSGTIQNARNRKGNLCGVTLAAIGSEFGPVALQPFAALFGGICASTEAQKPANDFMTISALSVLAGEWVRRLADGNRCHKDTCELADMLRPLVSGLQSIIEQADEVKGRARA